MPIYPGSKTPMPFFSGILKSIKSFNPDIIHIDEPERIWLTQPRLLKKLKKMYPVIGFFHTDHLSFLKEYRIHFLKRLLDRLFLKAYSNCDEIFASTVEANKRFFNTNIKYRIDNYLGIPLELFQTNGLNKNKRFLTIVGRISPDRGIDQLIKILPFCNLKNYVEGIRFVGDGPLSEKVARLKLDIPVEITGFVDRKLVAKYLSETKILLSSCRAEAFGLSLIEAFAYNLPVVCPQSPATYKFLEYGMPIYLYELSSANSLIYALNEAVIFDPLKANYNLKIWDIRNCTDNLLNAYIDVKNKKVNGNI